MDGLDIAFVNIQERAGAWTYELRASHCAAFSPEWQDLLPQLPKLSGHELMLAHARFGRWMGEQVNHFIQQHSLFHQVHFIVSHGHTVFHEPKQHLSFQLGDAAQIAALTEVPVISDLRHLDVALEGQGAPIVPMAEKLLWPEFQLFLNLGGIANLSLHTAESVSAFDVCAANRVLNLLAAEAGMAYDVDGQMASGGHFDAALFDRLSELSYYKQQAPKSLSNQFGTHEVYPILQSFSAPLADKMHTYCLHMAWAIAQSIGKEISGKILVSGGGAMHAFLMQCIREALKHQSIEVVMADPATCLYKEAIAMALLGVLRWREENTVLPSVTGAQRGSSGGCIWMGQS